MRKHTGLIDCTIVHKAGKPEKTHFFGRELAKQRFAIPQDIHAIIDSRYDAMIMSALRVENPTLSVYQVKDDQ